MICNAEFARLIVQLAHFACMPKRMFENESISDILILEKLTDSYNEFNAELSNKIQRIEEERRQKAEALRIAEEESKERLRIAEAESKERMRIANEKAKLEKELVEQKLPIKVRVSFKYRVSDSFDDRGMLEIESRTIDLTTYNALVSGGEKAIKSYIESNIAGYLTPSQYVSRAEMEMYSMGRHIYKVFWAGKDDDRYSIELGNSKEEVLKRNQDNDNVVVELIE